MWPLSPPLSTQLAGTTIRLPPSRGTERAPEEQRGSLKIMLYNLAGAVSSLRRAKPSSPCRRNHCPFDARALGLRPCTTQTARPRVGRSRLGPACGPVFVVAAGLQGRTAAALRQRSCAGPPPAHGSKRPPSGRANTTRMRLSSPPLFTQLAGPARLPPSCCDERESWHRPRTTHAARPRDRLIRLGAVIGPATVDAVSLRGQAAAALRQ